ncbi:MAG: hypothetical protein JW966_00045 [Anaerolineae bacterium]|nr:hypothetical protein [Anaerolineae bacterium]
MQHRRRMLHHIIERALKRNTFTADQHITVDVLGDSVVLRGVVSHSDLIAEAVATVEAVAPFLDVYSCLRVRCMEALA